MKLTVERYGFTLFTAICLLVLDIVINTVLIIVKLPNVWLLTAFIVQDVCIIISLLVLFLTFFSTYVFKAGLVELLYERFRVTIVVCIVYFFLNIGLHISTLIIRWDSIREYKWNIGLTVVFVIQRFTGVLYYYFYKRSTLRLSDPRFYEDVNWMKNQIQQ